MDFKIIFGAVLLCWSLSAFSADNDFDRVCGFFQELETQKDLDKMSAQERGNFVLSRINKQLDETSVGRMAWDLIGSAVAEHRYRIFKEAAEETLGKPWNCAAMQRLAATAGE